MIAGASMKFLRSEDSVAIIVREAANKYYRGGVWLTTLSLTRLN